MKTNAPDLSLAGSHSLTKPHYSITRPADQTVGILGFVPKARFMWMFALFGLNVTGPVTAQTIDFGTVTVGESRVGETEKVSYRAFPHDCLDVRASLLNPQSRREDNSGPFSFAESPSFQLCSWFGSKESKRVKVTFHPTTSGTFTRLLRIVTSKGGEQYYNLIGRAEPLPPLSVVHVNSQYTGGSSDGSLSRPYRAIRDGLDRLASCGTLKVRAGQYPGRLVLNTCLHLESYDGPVQLGGVPQGADQLSDGWINASPEINMSPASTSVATLQSSSALRPSDGALLLVFTGAPGQLYQVLSSTNLASWEVWVGLDAEEGTVGVEVPATDRDVNRFFKMRALGDPQSP